MQQLIDNDDLLPVFVYGSLRWRCANWPVIEPAVESTRLHVTAPGKLFMHECGLFPVFVVDHNHIAFGHLFHVHANSYAWQTVMAMEVNAGYEARWVEVVDTVTGAVTKALVFAWPSGNGLDPIPGNDWLLATPADGIH